MTDEVLKGRAQIFAGVTVCHSCSVVAQMIGQSLQAPRLEMGRKFIDETEDLPELVCAGFGQRIRNLEINRQHQIAKFGREWPQIVQRLDDRSLASKLSGVLPALLALLGRRSTAFRLRPTAHRVAESVAAADISSSM